MTHTLDGAPRRPGDTIKFAPTFGGAPPSKVRPQARFRAMPEDSSHSLLPGSIHLAGLGKAYRLYPSKWGRAAEWLGSRRQHELRWVLRAIDLRISPGEAVGIVGENGAGKSTLLKLITGVSRPTEGSFVLAGRVAALLELGIGFREGFTGRQNAVDMLRLNGADDAEIPALLTDIEAFADVGEYFDLPVRTYSSGMQCRLAFATATAVRPDILIVDEALAVGDVFFQQRCFDRISAFRESGTTLLFVSHSTSAIFALCNRAVLLREGGVAIDSAPKAVIDLYNAQAIAKNVGGDIAVSEQSSAEPYTADIAPPSAGSYESGGARLKSLILVQGGRPAKSVMANAPVTLRVQVHFLEAVNDPHVGFQVRDRRGEVMYRTHTHGLGASIGAVALGESIEVEFTFDPCLMHGEYTITVGVGAGGKPGGAIDRAVLRHQDATSFSVIRSPDDDHWDGVANLRSQVASRRLEAASSSE